MVIVQINAVYGHSSTGLIVQDIHTALRNAGHESFVVCPEPSADEFILPIGSTIDRKIHALVSRANGKQGLCSEKQTKKMLSKLDQIAPDVIHLHNIHSNYLNYKYLLQYTEKNRIPVLLTLHDSWFFTGKCFHFYDVGCEKWKIGCGACPKRYSEIPSFFRDSSAEIFALRKELYDNNRMYIVGCSQWITNCARESPLFEHASVCCIRNGIDLSVFSPEKQDMRSELGLECRDFVIVTMANKWFADQNAPIREKLMQSLTPEDRLLIVGCSQTQILENKHGKIVMLPFIRDREYLSRVYNSGNLFLNLSLIDTLPTVNMEAAGCGLPVVTYDAGGSGELVKDGETGYVIPALDSQKLCEAIMNIKLGKIKSDTCRAWADAHFDKEMNYRRYLDLYSEIVSMGK